MVVHCEIAGGTLGGTVPAQPLSMAQLPGWPPPLVDNLLHLFMGAWVSFSCAQHD
jgi:hypothetical protein